MAFTVEITSNDDGTYTVKSESEAMEDQEGAQGAMPSADPMAAAPGAPVAPLQDQEAEEPAGQTVKTIKEALTLALEALKNGGEMSDLNGQDADFNAGFGGKQAGAAQ